jgi:RNA chaperone Hfq
MIKLKNSMGQLEKRLSKIQEHPFRTANDLINDFLGKSVAVRLRTGEIVEGNYTRYDKYHILIESDGKPMLLFKHAIESIREP